VNKDADDNGFGLDGVDAEEDTADKNVDNANKNVDNDGEVFDALGDFVPAAHCKFKV
jgi:hypothetical protein